MNEREQLTRVCQGIGASPQQAGAMADQLIKRCDQLMTTRGISREEAMTYLLNLVVKGAAGETPPGFEATTPPATAGGRATRNPLTRGLERGHSNKRLCKPS